MDKFTNIVMDDGWVHPLANTLPSLVNNLWWNIVMHDWNLGEKSLDKWQVIATLSIYNPPKFYKQWQTMLGSHLVLVTLYRGLQLVLSKTIRIGDTKYHVQCSLQS